MNTSYLICITGALAALVVPLSAGPRTSTNYNVATDITDAGGKRTTSVAYTNDGSVGGVVGISTVTAPAESAKHGYIGQLTEVTALQIAATPATINETATRQLSGVESLDDLTTNTILGASITWSIVSGPLGINTNGLAIAATVYENTDATAQGSYAGATGTIGLTVLDTIPDNYGSYAGDSIGDDWQFQYFGLNNPNAAPLLDPDFDGHNNLFEFTAGLVPTDATSFFHVQIEPVAGFNTQKKILISPRFNDRTYTIKTSTSLLSNSWISLTGGTVSDNGTERTITDTSATQPLKFYRVEITKP